MSSSSHKFYHLHDMDVEMLYGTFASKSTERTHLDELIIFPLKEIYKMLQSGRIKGDTLIDLSAGPCIFHLFPLCNIFKEFIVLEFNDSCMKTLQKWMNKEPDVLDWSHATKIAAEMEGCRVNWEEKEEDVRKRIKNILKCDFTKENPTDPVILRNADCVFCLYVLEHISENLDAFHANVKKIASMLKKGGCLLLVSVLNGTHYTVAEHKYHFLNHDEADVRTALQNAGFTVEHNEVLGSKLRNNVIYFEHMSFICAFKNWDV
uniref:Nicotinamide N-methyltransferase n=1 Tax=Leptobrachium leishanense TaxID=445787 RepID=A0A8C5R9S1_9ANUR